MIEAAIPAPIALALLTALVVPFAGVRHADRVNAAGSCLTAAAAIAIAIAAAVGHADPPRGSWYVLDGAGAAFLAVIAVVGLLSALASPGYLGGAEGSFFGERAPRRSYYVAVQLFWAALLAVPLVDNLAIAWILIEATTAVSALLVASGGRRRALEAGLEVPRAHHAGTRRGAARHRGPLRRAGCLRRRCGRSTTTRSERRRAGLDGEAALLALVLIVGGLATKIGWAPVHNWLPDAHSEAPPPVSAMLSAALLPDRHAGRVARPARAGAGDRRRRVGAVPRVRPRIAGGRRAVPLAPAAAQAPARLFQPRAHGGPRARHRLRPSPGHRRRRDPRRWSRAGQVARLLRRDPAAARGRGAEQMLRASLNTSSRRGRSGDRGLLASLSGMPPAPLFVSELLIALGGSPRARSSSS